MATRAAKIPSHEDVDLEEDRPQPGGEGVRVDLDDLDQQAERARSAKKGGAGEKPPEDPPELEDHGAGAIDRSQEEDRTEARREERRARKDFEERREREQAQRLESAERKLAQLEGERVRQTVEGRRGRIGDIEREQHRLGLQYKEARALKAKAWEEKNGQAAVEADEIMQSATRTFDALGAEKDRLIYEDQVEQQERAQPRASPALKKNAEGFMGKLKWFDAKGGDRDSAKVIQLDRQMANVEGWDPNTPGYWQELETRVREELPHRFEGAKDDKDADEPGDRQERRPRQRTGGSGGEGGGEGGRGGKNTFYLSPDRVRYMKEADLWDDPAVRRRTIRRFQAYDREHARDRRP